MPAAQRVPGQVQEGHNAHAVSSHTAVNGDLQLSIFLFILVSLKQVEVTGLVYSHVMLSLVRYFIQFLKTTTTTKTCLLGLEIAFGNM